MIYTRKQICAVEDNSERLGVSRAELMENAGKAAFEALTSHYSDLRSITVVCGKGNNGGDGLVVARYCVEQGIKTSVILTDGKFKSDNCTLMFNKLSGAEIINYQTEPDGAADAVMGCDLVVDAVFGTGFRGNVNEDIACIIRLINESSADVVSLDLPSGAECDNARVSDPCVKADMTVSFISKKPCHIFYPAAEYCGRVVTADIGVPTDSYVDETVFITDENDVKPFVSHKRPAVCNKYDFGRAMLVCGSYGMAGAAKIAAHAAVKCGAGLVSLCVPKSIYAPGAANLSEVVFHPLDENELGRISSKKIHQIIKFANKSDCVLVGCGLGCDSDTKQIVYSLIEEATCPIIIDADGINCIASNINIIKKAKVPVILTPHMGEMSRMVKMSCQEISENLLEVGKRFAEEYNAVLVLKGPRTVVFEPGSNAFVNTTACSAMATAGTGDMLAGMIASFCSQKIGAVDAARLAVFLHGKSGIAAAKIHSERATTPTDMIACLDDIFLCFESDNEGD